MRLGIIACFGAISLLASSAAAQDDAFRQGQVSLGLTGGGGPGGFGIGFDVGYMALDGIEVSLGSAFWMLEDTNLVQITPGARYIIKASDSVMPYVGVFGRRWFFTDDAYRDSTSMGGRAGAYLRTGGGTILSIGAAYERILDCPDTLEDQCASIYPEFGLALLF